MGPLHHANVCHKHCFGGAQGTFLLQLWLNLGSDRDSQCYSVKAPHRSLTDVLTKKASLYLGAIITTPCILRFSKTGTSCEGTKDKLGLAEAEANSGGGAKLRPKCDVISSSYQHDELDATAMPT